MRLISTSLLGALAAAALVGPASAAPTDSYLKFGTVTDGTAARGGHKDWIEVQSWSWGTSNARKGWDGTIKGRRDAVRAPGRIEVPLDAASGMPTGKRQHGWMPGPGDFNSGSVRIKVKFPWLDCKVGAAFPDVTLDDAAARYELKNVMVSSCPVSSSGGDQPTESVTLNYSKVIVRGWDPEKKE